MVQARCIQKYRDKNNNIKGYLLEDCNGQQLRVTPEQLKMAIFSKQIEITNLTLTQDGRLIDKGEPVTVKNKTIERDAKFEIFCSRMRQIPVMVFKNDEEAEDYANSIEATKTIEYIIDSLNDLLDVKMQKFSFCSTREASNRYFTCSGLLFYLSLGGGEGKYIWGAWCNEDIDILDVYEDGYNDDNSITHNYEIYMKMKEIINYKPIPLYDLALSVFEITSKFTDTKYSTVGRYIIADDMEIGGSSALYQQIKYKRYNKRGGYLRDISIDAPLIDITINVLDSSDNQYVIAIGTSSSFKEYTGRNDERLICGDASFRRGDLDTNRIIGKYTSFIIDAHNKNYKKELKLVLEQEFKKAYHNLKMYIDKNSLLK